MATLPGYDSVSYNQLLVYLQNNRQGSNAGLYLDHIRNAHRY